MMSAAAYLPAITAPPHDPTSLLLNRRLGWRVLESSQIVAKRTFRLDRFPGSLRPLTEPSGSFGGLRTPYNVALDETGVLWLLDQFTCVLKRFDFCACEFVEFPCFDGIGGGARQLNSPEGIAVSHGTLYVCDTGNSRLSVFALPSAALMGHWSPPGSWTPTGVVVTRHGVVLVADPSNGAIHRFTPQGDYIGAWTGFGDSSVLALDRWDNVYAAGISSVSQAYRVGESGQPIIVTEPADDLRRRFDELPFQVDSDGKMYLGTLCSPEAMTIFDVNGAPTVATIQPTVQMYQTSGWAILGPLDSLIDQCVWHRVILRGCIPTGCAVTFKTFTSQITLPQSEIDVLPDYAWDTNVQATTTLNCQWDCLIRGTTGRFLWLGVSMTGNGNATPDISSLEIEFPRISLRRYMPSVYGTEPVSADFTDRLMGIFDRTLRDKELILDNLAHIFDPISTPWPDWLASWIGVTLDRQLPDKLRRKMLKEAPAINDMRGTRYALYRQLISYLGFDRVYCHDSLAHNSCSPPTPTCPPTPKAKWHWDTPPLILEHFKLRTWLFLGSGRLGDQSRLWGDQVLGRSRLGFGAQLGATKLDAAGDPSLDPFTDGAYKFTVFVPCSAGATPQKRMSLENLIKRESPAYTECTIEYVKPRFLIGVQSMIGLNSVVGRWPEGVVLGETTLGDDKVLTGKQEPTLGSARLGSTAMK